MKAPNNGSRFFARTRKGLPPVTPWIVEEIGYYDGKAIFARCMCYCFNGSRARAIARALNKVGHSIQKETKAS